MADSVSSGRSSGLLRRLRLQLAVLFALILISLAVFEGGEVLRGHDSARREAEERVDHLAKTLAENTAGLLREADARLAMIAEAVAAERLDLQGLRSLLERQRTEMPDLATILAIDGDGRVLAESGGPAARPLDLERLALTAASGGAPDGLQIGLPTRGVLAPAWTMTLVRQASARGGPLRIVAGLDLGRFEDVYASLELSEGASITLVRGDGALLVRWPHVDRLMGADLARRPSFATYLEARNAGVFEGVSLDTGAPAFIAWRWVPGFEVVVTVAQLRSVAFAEWREETASVALGALVVGLLAIGLAWMALRRLNEADRSARALQASEQSFRDFASAASDWFWEADADYRLFWISSRFRDFTGIDPAVRIGGSPLDLQRPDDDPEAWSRHRADVAARRMYRNFRCRMRDAAGRDRELSVSGHPAYGADGRFLGWRGATSDVTSQVAAEARAGAAEARLANALELATDGYALFDPEGRFVFANREYLRINADMADQVRVGARLEDALREAARRSGAAATQAGEKGIAEALARLREPSEPYVEERGGRWIRIVDQPLPGGGALTVMRDVTLERGAEAQLREAERLQAVGHVVGGAAHDFNNLLMAILGNAALARDWVAGDPRLERALDSVLGAARRGGEITRQLLAYARRQALDPVAADLDQLVRDDVAALRRRLPAALAVETDLGAGSWRALVDPRQFAKVLASLALNAADAMPAGGRLRFQTAAVRLEAAEAPPGCAPGEYVRLTVSDDGPGMAPDVAARAFEPFFTTKGIGQGSGLGLSMVFGFMKQSGGAIALRTAPGEGAAFDLYFPRLPEEPSALPA